MWYKQTSEENNINKEKRLHNKDGRRTALTALLVLVCFQFYFVLEVISCSPVAPAQCVDSQEKSNLFLLSKFLHKSR